MLNQQQRLSKFTWPVGRDFKPIHTPTLLVFTKANSLETVRAAIVVSKKVSKRAVDRNLIKRRLSHLVAGHAERLRGFDLIIIAKPGILDLSFSQLSDQVSKVIGKISF